jgi:hypothetical protein
MKLLYFTPLIMLVSWTPYSLCVDPTAIVAADMRYPQQITTLRNKTLDQLRDLRIDMNLDVQDLRRHNLQHRAEVAETLSKDTYFSLEDKVDRIFAKLDYAFVQGAKKLDYEEASLREKQDFINEMSSQAKQKVKKILTQNTHFFASHPFKY